MRVAALHAAGDVRVEERPDPVAGPGESLVRITSVGLCGSDLHWFAEGAIGDAALAAARARPRDGRDRGVRPAGRPDRRPGPRAAVRRLPGVRGRDGAPVHPDGLRRAQRHGRRPARAHGLARPAPAPVARRLRPGVRLVAGAPRGRRALGGPGAPAARRHGRRGRLRADRSHAGAARGDDRVRGGGRRAARAPARGGPARRRGPGTAAPTRWSATPGGGHVRRRLRGQRRSTTGSTARPSSSGRAPGSWWSVSRRTTPRRSRRRSCGARG